MSRRSLPPEAPRDSNAWMSTFSDLLMLMLTFFVLLLTMSSLDDQKIRSLTRSGIHVESTKSRTSAVKTDEVVERYRIQAELDTLRPLIQQGAIEPRDAERVKSIMEALLTESGITDAAWVEVRPNGMIVNLHGKVAFEEKSATLTSEAKQYLDTLAPVLRQDEINIEIDAWFAAVEVPELKGLEADDRAWELALMRAGVVAANLESSGVERAKLRTMGYGFEAGLNEKQFLRQKELLRMNIILGKEGAEPMRGTP